MINNTIKINFYILNLFYIFFKNIFSNIIIAYYSYPVYIKIKIVALKYKTDYMLIMW